MMKRIMPLLNNAIAEQYRELAKKEKNVIFGGRLASYKYYDMDDVIKEAFETMNNELINN